MLRHFTGEEERSERGEVKREKQKERRRLREQEEQPTGPAFIPLTLPHPLPAFGGQPCLGAALAADSRILNAELTARRRKPLSSAGNDSVSYDISI